MVTDVATSFYLFNNIQQIIFIVIHIAMFVSFTLKKVKETRNKREKGKAISFGAEECAASVKQVGKVYAKNTFSQFWLNAENNVIQQCKTVTVALMLNQHC